MGNGDPPGKTGLQAAAEVVKYLSALGTGAIVFSAGLLNDKLFLPLTAKWFMFFSWCVLACSVLAGLFAGMRIPILLSEQNYKLEDKFLKWPGLIQQVAFFFGIVLLGTALTLVLIAHGNNQTPGKQSSAQPTVQPSPTPHPTS
jgi:hypothetical protein